MLAVPLFGGGQTFGVLVVGNHDTSGLGEDEAALVSSLANQSAVALENARLYRRIQSMAVLEERERIAREMHDGLAQVLGFVNTKAIAVARLLEVGRPESARTQLSELESMVRSLYADVREAIIGLRTAPRPDCGLCQALRDYLEAFQQQSDIPVELRVGGDEGELHLPFAAEIQLLRIVQEALANVRKHSGAGRAAVCVVPVDGTVTLTIEDDGQGFDPARKGHGGWPRFGLKTMSERAESVHGTFAVESRRGAGTRVVVTVPREHAGGHDVDDARTAG